MAAPCGVEGCEKPRHAKGLCSTHRWRLKRHGDPLAVTIVRNDDERRFLTKVVVQDDGCWCWTGSRTPKGYGRVGVAGKTTAAHRWAYEMFVGPIPAGMQIDHLCHFTSCVNPQHLEAVTSTENQRRRRPQSIKGACLRGHPFIPGSFTTRSNGGRNCRACERLRKQHAMAVEKLLRRVRRDLRERSSASAAKVADAAGHLTDIIAAIDHRADR